MTNKVQKCVDIFEEFPSYTSTNFINDMDHIIKYHKLIINNDQDDQNKDTFNTRIKLCELPECKTFELNDKESENMDANRMVLYQFVQENHVFLFHKNRMGDRHRGNRYRPTRYIYGINPRSINPQIDTDDNDNDLNESVDEEEEEEKATELTQQQLNKETLKPQIKQNKLKKIQKEASQPQQSQSQQSLKVDSSSNNGIPPDIIDEAQNEIFSFGWRFDYQRWVDQTIKNPHYVGCKYENLKKELIDDPEKNITKAKWNMLLKFSTKKAETLYSKKFVAHETEYGWSTKAGKSMSTARVLAIVLYTNYDDLQKALKQSFIMQSGYSSRAPPKDAKKLHSRFGHWSKLLRSSVDVFGQRMTDKDRFYRGYDRKLKFRLFSCTFRGPISTTTKLGVAQSFALDRGAQGIVVEIRKPTGYDKSRYLSVSMWSSYKGEEEHLFNGPDNWLNITTINYGKSFNKDKGNTLPLLLFQSMTQRSYGVNIEDLIVKTEGKIVKRLNKLLKNCRNKDKKDDYLCSLLTHYCSQTKSLKIGLKVLRTLIETMKEKGERYQSEMHKLLDLFFDESKLIGTEKKIYINLVKCIDLFKNLNEIIIDFGGWSLWLNEDNKTWKNLLEYFWATNGKRGLRFRKIAMKRFPKARFPSDGIISRMIHDMYGTKWKVQHVVTPRKTPKIPIPKPNRNKGQDNGEENKNDDQKMSAEESVIYQQLMAVASRPPQHVLYFIKEDNYVQSQRQKNLSPMTANTFNNPASNHLLRKSSKKKPKPQRGDKK